MNNGLASTSYLTYVSNWTNVLTNLTLIGHLNLMAGHPCFIIHWLNLQVCVNVKNGQLKAIKAPLRLSRRHVLALMFGAGFFFIVNHLQPQKQSSRRLWCYLGHRCPAIRFMCTRRQQTPSLKQRELTIFCGWTRRHSPGGGLSILHTNQHKCKKGYYARH